MRASQASALAVIQSQNTTIPIRIARRAIHDTFCAISSIVDIVNDVLVYLCCESDSQLAHAPSSLRMSLIHALDGMRLSLVSIPSPIDHGYIEAQKESSFMF